MKSAVEIFFNFFSMKSAVEFFSSIFCSKSLKTKHFIPDAPTDLGDFSFLLYLLSNVKETNHMLRLGGAIYCNFHPQNHKRNFKT